LRRPTSDGFVEQVPTSVESMTSRSNELELVDQVRSVCG
jgi:hypothetical protein